MAAQLHLHLAQQIVETLKTVCDHDINYIDPEGIITASTDPRRVGSYHEGGHEAARTGRIVTIRDDDPARDLRRGINMPIRFHGRTVTVIGITGEPEQVRRYADLAQRLTLLLLREQELEARDYDKRAQTGFLVRALMERAPVSTELVTEVLRQNGLAQDPGSWRSVIVHLRGDGGEPLAQVETALDGVLDRLGGCLRGYAYPSTHLVLVPEDRFARRQGLLQELAAEHPALRIAVGSPRPLARQHRSAQAARLALRSMAPGQNYAVYESMGLELLLDRKSVV